MLLDKYVMILPQFHYMALSIIEVVRLVIFEGVLTTGTGCRRVLLDTRYLKPPNEFIEQK